MKLCTRIVMRATRRRGLTLRITLSARSKNFIGVPAQPWLPAMAPHVIRVVHAGQFRASTGQCCLHTSVLQAWIILHNKRPCTTFALPSVPYSPTPCCTTRPALHSLHHIRPSTHSPCTLFALHHSHCTALTYPYSPCTTLTVPHSP